MEHKSGFIGHRKAFIHTINDSGTYDIFYSDDNSNNVIKDVGVVNIGSFGSGIFTRYHVGAPVWIGQSYYYQPLIVGFADISGDIERGEILNANDIDIPRGDPGEVFLQASSGAHMDLTKDGDIKISNLTNDGIILSDAHRALLFNSFQHYNINDSGYTIEGRVRRFHPKYLPGSSPVFVDLLASHEADAFTIDVARDTSQKATPMNRDRGTANITRNPAFAEKREVILEFADSFFVRDVNTETELSKDFPKTLQEMNDSIARRRGYGDNEQVFNDLRHSSRTNVLRLDNNVIIERIQGTLVDIFSNVLDINYNKINLPRISEKGKDSISEAHTLLSRSIAYHFQVNSRNDINKVKTGAGKFIVDIDKEGQFKLNVPRSSSNGTIPTITNFILGNTDTASRTDINSTQLSKSTIISPTGGLAGTAFHDMVLTADRLIRHNLTSINPIRVHGNTLGIQNNGDTPNIEFVVGPENQFPDTIPDYTTTISVMPDAAAISQTIDPNASGGRSGLMNFEGSVEISIGKDDGDEKSLLLDTAGSLVAWFGADANGRSIVANTDGSVLLNIGDYTLDDNDVPIFNPGLLAVRVNLVDEKKKGALKIEEVADSKDRSDHILYLGPKGMIFTTGNGTPLVIRSSGDMLLESAGCIDLKAKEIRMDAGQMRKVSTKKGDI